MKLFAAFEPVSTEAWIAQITKDLKGADFEKRLVSKTLDGIAIKPVYRQEDVRHGVAESVRRGYPQDSNDWKNREQIRETDVARANAHALRALESGAQELSILTYPIGVPVFDQDAMTRFLDGIFLEMVHLHWQPGPFAAQTYAMLLNEVEHRGLGYGQVLGSIDHDPIVDAACGWTTSPLRNWLEVSRPLLEALVETTPNLQVLTIRGSLIEKSGASVAQELALTMALFTEYLTGFAEAGFDLAEIAARTEFRYGVGSHFFLEIAKLRAHRLLVANVLKGFGVEATPKIHADTTTSNKTLYDAHNNLLRGTIEAMAASIAGVDSLTVATFEQVYATPDEFGEHLARNTESLLKEEAFLTKVLDPLGGAYYVESLTDSVASAAWELFQKIESQGGFIAAWESGMIPAEIERIKAEKVKRIRRRQTPIIGTSVFPNPKERRAEMIGTFRKSKVMRHWHEAEADLGDLRRGFTHGDSLAKWETDAPLPSTAFDSFRPARAFESLRLRMERHPGKTPVVMLAQLGNPARRKARAEFCLGFFGCGGYAVESPNAFASVEDALHAAEGVDILVLCAADEDYATLVPPARAGFSGKLVIAGLPDDHEALKDHGADLFVHVRLDVVETLEQLHAAFGIAKETER